VVLPAPLQPMIPMMRMEVQITLSHPKSKRPGCPGFPFPLLL
jgi:hypothetical protein